MNINNYGKVICWAIRVIAQQSLYLRSGPDAVSLKRTLCDSGSGYMVLFLQPLDDILTSNNKRLFAPYPPAPSTACCQTTLLIRLQFLMGHGWVSLPAANLVTLVNKLLTSSA